MTVAPSGMSPLGLSKCVLRLLFACAGSMNSEVLAGSGAAGWCDTGSFEMLEFILHVDRHTDHSHHSAGYFVEPSLPRVYQEQYLGRFLSKCQSVRNS